jgi:hypothetical protein
MVDGCEMDSLVQDRNQWRALLNTVMKLQILKGPFPDFMNDFYLPTAIFLTFAAFSVS